MKIVIISDSHGHIQRIRHVVGFIAKIKADAIIHCGDWDNEESVVEVAKAKIPVYGVLGNADYNPFVEGKLSQLKIVYNPDVLEIEVSSKKILVCHFPGRLIQELDKEKGIFDIAFHGHTHREKEAVYKGTKIVNPGALQSLTPSFAIYDLDANAVEFIDIEV
ncbi:MAG: YfcE family phosphodiesterase [Patescibacteria group bacterium]